MNRSHIEFLSSSRWAEMLETDLLPWLAGIGSLGTDVMEIGPGPGLTTDLLRQRTDNLTAVEVDPDLAAALAERMRDTNVAVFEADASSLPFESDRFSAAVCFSVLHHIPTSEDQDRLFAEVARVLQPGGIFAGVDSKDLTSIRDSHEGDTFNPVSPTTLQERLASAGLAMDRLDEGEYQIRFVARRPQ